MKKGKELDVDFIGGTSTLTKEEEKRISEIIQRHKIAQKVTPQTSKRKSTTKKRVV